MMVFCGRRHGLYANLTRFVYFREPTAVESERHRKVAEIEAVAFNALKIGQSTVDVYTQLASAYAEHGYQDDILNHHQGGPCGYLSRYEVSRPVQSGFAPLTMQANMAFAWNPSLTATKIEDTVLLGADGKIEILTFDPQWPSEVVAGRNRPGAWIRHARVQQSLRNEASDSSASQRSSEPHW